VLGQAGRSKAGGGNGGFARAQQVPARATYSRMDYGIAVLHEEASMIHIFLAQRANTIADHFGDRRLSFSPSLSIWRCLGRFFFAARLLIPRCGVPVVKIYVTKLSISLMVGV